MTDMPDSNDDKQKGTVAVSASDIKNALKVCFEDAYNVADLAHKAQDYSSQKALLGDALYAIVEELASVKHAARGIVITLAGFKAICPQQDIRAHKAEYPGGFSARAIDNAVTVPFLQGRSLYYNVETHWLSQTFSFAGPYTRDLVLKTTPKKAGKLMIDVVNAVEEANSTDVARAVLERILAALIEDRNRSRVELEKPQNLSIDQVVGLLDGHFLSRYAKNAPRLPQVAMYAMYECIMPTVARYSGMVLKPLERMKSADRKSGSVGDIDVNKGDLPFEAVEIKFQVAITREHVAEAIQKIKTASVQRYLILSTSGIGSGEMGEIERLQRDFRRSNGCEIVINGVLETLKYYLRLIDSPSTFTNRYTALVETDPDLGYEHRIAWNTLCAERRP